MARTKQSTKRKEYKSYPRRSMYARFGGIPPPSSDDEEASAPVTQKKLRPTPAKILKAMCLHAPRLFMVHVNDTQQPQHCDACGDLDNNFLGYRCTGQHDGHGFDCNDKHYCSRCLDDIKDMPIVSDVVAEVNKKASENNVMRGWTGLNSLLNNPNKLFICIFVNDMSMFFR